MSINMTPAPPEHSGVDRRQPPSSEALSGGPHSPHQRHDFCARILANILRWELGNERPLSELGDCPQPARYFSEGWGCMTLSLLSTQEDDAHIFVVWHAGGCICPKDENNANERSHVEELLTWLPTVGLKEVGFGGTKSSVWCMLLQFDRLAEPMSERVLHRVLSTVSDWLDSRHSGACVSHS